MQKATILFDAVLHKYTDTDGNVYTSATQVIDQYKPKFNKVFWAYYRAIDKAYRGYGTPKPDVQGNRIFFKIGYEDNGRYYSILELSNGIIPFEKHPDMVLHEWQLNADAACERGNKEHNYLEDSIDNVYGHKEIVAKLTVVELADFKVKVDTLANLEKSSLKETHASVFDLLKQLIEKGFTIYAEKKVYSYEHKVSGTIDVLAVNADKEFYILDWKTNKDVLQFTSGYFKKAWNVDNSEKVKTEQWVETDERMYSPIADLQNCKGALYTLQLSLYARLCELWGLKCLGLILCHLRIEVTEGREIHHEPMFYSIGYLSEHIDRILAHQITKQKRAGRSSIK